MLFAQMVFNMNSQEKKGLNSQFDESVRITEVQLPEFAAVLILNSSVKILELPLTDWHV